MNKNYYAILMAGGVGSRFWPVSTEEFPKQFFEKNIKIKKQTPVRSASGRWELTIEGLPAGITEGTLNYVDISKTHADIELLLPITLAQGVDLPKPTPTPKPTTTKKPTDGCSKQIKH